MYTKLPKLNEQHISDLTQLMSEVQYSDKGIRMGANGIEKLSKYHYSKWYDWTRPQKQRFKDSLGTELIDQAVVGWFLKLPKNTGFLDLMNYWVDKKMAGVIASYALSDQDIWINNEKITVLRGEGIRFSLKNPHEIKISTKDQNWACVMLLK
jgi:hypothetical protein